MQSLGHETTTWIKSRDRLFPNERYDYDFTSRLSPENGLEKILYQVPVGNRVYKKVKQKYLTHVYKNSFNSLEDHDLYIYSWDTALHGYEDLKVLKDKGKKIIFLFIGSEARYAHAFNQEFPTTPIKWSKFHLTENINKKLNFLRKVEQFADVLFSLPDQSGLLVRPYNHMYMPLDSSNIRFNYPDNDIPRIVHAPTSRSIKGTEKILIAIETLKLEGHIFEFLLLENEPNHVVRKALEDADIVVDQIYAHGPGVFGSEAMAAGCAVATRYLKGYEEVYAPPVCYIDSDCLLINLRRLITDRDYRKSLAYAGHEFVSKYNDPKKIATRMLEKLHNPIHKTDYTPRFFLDKFKLETSERLSLQSKELNKQVIKQLDIEGVDWTDLKMRGLV